MLKGFARQIGCHLVHGVEDKGGREALQFFQRASIGLACTNQITVDFGQLLLVQAVAGSIAAAAGHQLVSQLSANNVLHDVYGNARCGQHCLLSLQLLAAVNGLGRDDHQMPR